MKKNRVILVAALFLAGAAMAAAQQGNKDALEIIRNSISANKFIEGTVSSADLDLILSAGINAPSAANNQPWKFIVVKTPALVAQTINDKVVPSGNLSIIVYAPGDGKSNIRAILDCALAVENIYLAAQALGYGSRIYTGTVENINQKLKREFGIPSNCSAVAVVRIGKIASRADAVSSASKRKSASELVTYK